MTIMTMPCDTEMEDFHNSSYSTPPKRNVLLLPAPKTMTMMMSCKLHNHNNAQTVPTKRKRHASGLANLGNTCFMNSTIQCLAHSDPLRRYFLSNQYTQDLNRHNPLGTGGELALQFASLLARNVDFDVRYYCLSSFLQNGAWENMPNNLWDTINTIRKNLPLYLLDALHEDTNRITQKPYIEKPEQGQDETDEQAAEVAWKLHLQREDSKVLDNFMGQVKSRVTCPTPRCGRVSTTFDPFMYLSVPIPGSLERTLQVTLVTLEHGSYTFSVTIQKLATMETMLEMVVNKYKRHTHTTTNQFVMDDLICVDVHNSHVYAHREFHNMCRHDSGSRCDAHLSTRSRRRHSTTRTRSDMEMPMTWPFKHSNLQAKSYCSSHQLDIGTLKELNVGDKWIDVLESVYAGFATQV